MKSLRNIRKVGEIVNRYQRGKSPDWDSWEAKSCIETLEYYQKINLISKRNGDYKKSFVELQSKMLSVFSNKEVIINKMVNSSVEFKMFLFVHSVFQVFGDTDDWFANTIRSCLTISTEEFGLYMKSKEVPSELLRKFEKFGPEPLYFEYYPIKISYGAWQRDDNDRIADPVMIVDTSHLGKKVGKIFYSAEAFISSFDIIDLNNWKPPENKAVWENCDCDDELPF